MFTDPYKFTQIVKQKAKPTDSARTLVVGLHLRWCALECAHRRWRRCLSLWRPRIMVLVLSQLLIMDKSPLLQSSDGWLIGREAAEFEASIKIAPALAEHGERLAGIPRTRVAARPDSHSLPRAAATDVGIDYFEMNKLECAKQKCAPQRNEPE